MEILTLQKNLLICQKKLDVISVKFQKRDIKSVYTKEELDSDRESPWGKKFIDQKLGLEFEKKEYDEINDYCKKIDINWFASAWDLTSLKFLDQYNLKFNKIASALITKEDFIIEVAKRKKYTFISTGMSEYHHIDNAVKIFREHECPFELMHCVSAYPCPEEILNLNIINRLKKI